MAVNKTGGYLIEIKYSVYGGFGIRQNGCLKQIGCLIQVTANTSFTVDLYFTVKVDLLYEFLSASRNNNDDYFNDDAYNSIVRLTLEYCSSVCNPYHQIDIDRLEHVQKQAARFVTNTYSKTPGTVTNILTGLKWTSLADRRKYSRLKLFHKIVYNHVDIDISHYLSPCRRQTRHHHHLAYQIPLTTSDYY